MKSIVEAVWNCNNDVFVLTDQLQLGSFPLEPFEVQTVEVVDHQATLIFLNVGASTTSLPHSK